MSWENIDYTFYTCKVYKLFFETHYLYSHFYDNFVYWFFIQHYSIVILSFIITHFLYTVSTPQCLSYFYTDI